MSTKGFQKILQHCDPFAVGCNNLQGERERRKTAFFEREDEDGKPCLLAEGHVRNVSKLLGEGGRVSKGECVCVCETVSKGQERLEDQDLPLREGSHHHLS